MTVVYSCHTLFLCVALTASLTLSPLSTQASTPENFPEVRFRNIKTIDNIDLGDSYEVLTDRLGYLWLNTEEGIARYDGYSLNHFTHDANDPNSIRENKDTSFLLGPEGKIWVGSHHGLSCYDHKTASFSFYPIKPEDSKEHTKHLNIQKIKLINKQEILLAVLGAGVYRFNLKTHEYQPLSYTNNLANHERATYAIAAIQDTRDNIWVSTEGAGIFKVHPNQKTITHYHENARAGLRIPSNNVRPIIEGPIGNMWIGTDEGIVKINPVGDVHLRIIKTNDTDSSLGANYIRDLFFDRHGDLWIGTDGGGVSLYKPEQNMLKTYRHSAGDPTSLNSNVVRAITEDALGDIWIGTYPSGYSVFHRATERIKLRQHKPEQVNGLSHPSVLAIEAADDDSVWLGTDGGGLNHYNHKTQTFHAIKKGDTTNNLCGNAVLSLAKDKDNHLWVGTWGNSLCRYNLMTKKFTHFPSITNQPNTPSQKNIWAMLSDSKGRLWIGTEGAGINRFDFETNTFTRIPYGQPSSTHLNGSLVWEIYEDRDGILWIGSATGGLSRLDPNTMTFKHYVWDKKDPNSIGSNMVLAVHEDKKDQLWIGTPHGLYVMNKKTEEFKSINIPPLSDTPIHTILEPESGVLWFGTSKGIMSFDTTTQSIQNYAEQYWGGGKFNYGAKYLHKSGEIFLGGINGLVHLHPNDVELNAKKPPIVFTNFQIFNRTPEIGTDNSPLKFDINFTDTITLNHTQTMFSFEFSALNYYDTARNHYKYKLEGFDKTWNNIGTDRKAIYTNLDPGNYTLRVIGSNNNGIWNDVGRKINIRQLSPPWQTWWAYMLYGLAFIGGLAQIIHTQRMKRKLAERQNQILESKVSERTKELNQKNIDIQSMLNNMKQGLFTIELGGIIHPEYSSYLEDIFETSSIKGQSVFDILFSNASISEDRKSQAQAAIDTIIGQSIMNYDFNRNLLIGEYEVKLNNKKKILSLDWNPIIHGNITAKLMATVRDVTKLRTMEAAAEEQQRELEIIGQLIKLTPDQFISFDRVAIKLLKDCNVILSKKKPTDLELEALFRNLHTLKGNARTYNFSLIANATHKSESALAAYKSSKSIQALHLMEDRIKTTKAVTEKYAATFYKVLHHDQVMHTGSASSHFQLSLESIDSIMQSLNAMKAILPKNSPVNNIQKLLQEETSVELNTLIEGTLKSLPSIAGPLGKPAPTVDINCSGIRFRQNAAELLNNIFTHLFRNAIDHGIEPPKERVKKGKGHSGKIKIYAEGKPGSMKLYLKDDGQGINIPKLHQLGLEQQRWRADDQVDTQTIANLIFEPSVSTKDTVTDISGRGIGMDAVKQFLLAKNGDIQLHLLNQTDTQGPHTPFTLEISLPDTMYYLTDTQIFST